MHRLCATTLVSAAIAIPVATQAETLHFCYDPYPPYTIVEEGHEPTGIKMDLLNAVVDRIDGLEAEVEILPWKRCQNAVSSGELDGILPLFPNDARRSYMAFSIDVLNEKSVFWRSRNNKSSDTAWDHDYGRIAHLRLGMLKGSYINEAMEQAFAANAKIERAPSVDALFLMLRYDRIDLVATDLLVGRYVAQGLRNSDEFEPLVPPISARASKFGLSRITGADQHLEAFDRAIRELHEEGEIERITNRE